MPMLPLKAAPSSITILRVVTLPITEASFLISMLSLTKLQLPSTFAKDDDFVCRKPAGNLTFPTVSLCCPTETGPSTLPSTSRSSLQEISEVLGEDVHWLGHCGGAAWGA
jgi:hypothetical protein